MKLKSGERRERVMRWARQERAEKVMEPGDRSESAQKSFLIKDNLREISPNLM